MIVFAQIKLKLGIDFLIDMVYNKK